jgi:hypothetical protein
MLLFSLIVLCLVGARDRDATFSALKTVPV